MFEALECNKIIEKKIQNISCPNLNKNPTLNKDKEKNNKRERRPSFSARMKFFFQTIHSIV